MTSDLKRQVTDGRGGCFNERGWKAMEVLSDSDREEIMEELFDPEAGRRLNLCRTPIGANSNLIWNLVLDEAGLSTGGWPQCSPVVLDTKQREVIRTPCLPLYQHFSHFVEPGAHRVAVEGDWGDKLAFVNPDGSVVRVVANRSDSDHPLTLNIHGRRSGRLIIPARSFNTFVSAGS